MHRALSGLKKEYRATRFDTISAVVETGKQAALPSDGGDVGSGGGGGGGCGGCGVGGLESANGGANGGASGGANGSASGSAAENGGEMGNTKKEGKVSAPLNVNLEFVTVNLDPMLMAKLVLECKARKLTVHTALATALIFTHRTYLLENEERSRRAVARDDRCAKYFFKKNEK